MTAACGGVPACAGRLGGHHLMVAGRYVGKNIMTGQRRGRGSKWDSGQVWMAWEPH